MKWLSREIFFLKITQHLEFELTSKIYTHNKTSQILQYGSWKTLKVISFVVQNQQVFFLHLKYNK